MKIIEPSVEIINPVSYEIMLNTVELATRNCYQSFDKMTDNSAEGLIRGCLVRHHDSPLEFGDITVKLVTDVGTLGQLTRHRLSSFCVRSTRYVNFSKDRFGGEISFIEPKGLNNDAYDNWKGACKVAEAAYMVMTKDLGTSAEVARSVLPYSLATTIFMKANIREWRHIFSLRCSQHSQTEIRELMLDALAQMYKLYPVFFEDLYAEFIGIKVCKPHVD